MRIKGFKISGSITKKIIASYILIIIFALIIVGLIFSFLAKFYTERQAKNQLIKDASSIYNVITNTQLDGNIISDANIRQAIRQNIIPEISSLESNFTIISRDLRIIYPRNEEANIFKTQIMPKIQSKLNLK
ncbi:MAG: hypothetical protein Q8942_20355, partial [Bacillota bacterium]|nr:hypothetical protein [Bacillota bacterium]